MHFHRERVDSFYDLRGYLPDAHFEKRSSQADLHAISPCVQRYLTLHRTPWRRRHYRSGDKIGFTCPVV